VLLALLCVLAAASCRETTAPAQWTATSIHAFGGDGQNGRPNAPLDSAIVVRVEDARGAAVTGARVQFSIVAGGGRVSPAEALTDREGLARAGWTLGPLVESTQELAAVVTRGGADPLQTTFTAVAEPTGPVAAITTLTPSMLRPGTTLRVNGSNLDHVTGVTAAGVALPIIEQGPDELTVRLPETGFTCAPTVNVSVVFTAAGGAVLRTMPLRVAPERTLARGGMLIGSAADPLTCVELPADGRRYVIAVTNIATDTAVRPGLRVRGVAGPGQTADALVVHAGAAAARSPDAAADPGIGAAASPGSKHTPLPVMPTAGWHATPAASLDPVVGDTLPMRIPRLDSAPTADLCTSYELVRTRVVHVGASSVVLEDRGNPMAGTLDTLYRAVADEFDNRQLDVLRDNFGDPLPAGQRLWMLFSRRVNTYGATGFVWHGDLQPRSSCEQSNEVPVFYGYAPVAIGDQYGTGTRAEWYWNIRTTVVHEAKHIVAFRERLASGLVAEEPWLEEATAMVAEELWARRVFGYGRHDNVGYAQSVGCEIDGAFGRPPCVGRPGAMFGHFHFLAHWMREPAARTVLGPTAAGDVGYYGGAWLLLRWLLDEEPRPESAVLRELTTATEHGISNLEARFGRQFEELFPRWAAAVALDDRSDGPPAHGVPSWDMRDVYSGLNREQPALFPTTYPLRVRTFAFGNVQTDVAAIRGGGAAFFELAGGGPAPQALVFTGAADAPLPASFRIVIVRID
jgi:hypothetical protein